MMNTNNTNTNAISTSAAASIIEISAVKPSAAAVRFYAAEMRNACIMLMRSGNGLFAAAFDSVVYEYAIRAAVGCKLFTPEKAEAMTAAERAAFAADVLPAFVSVSIKGSGENIRRLYRVKGVSAAVRAVKSVYAAADTIGEIISVNAPKTKTAAERTSRKQTPADRLARAEYNLAKARAEVAHDITSGEFTFPTFAEWKTAAAEVTAE